MKRILLFVLVAASLLAASLLAATPPKPKLVLVIIVDQFRYDYLARFRNEFTGGFDRLLKNGASFTDAQDDYFPTLTATGHATILSGAMPSKHGIVGNEWFDRVESKHVTSVSDSTTQLVGGPGGEGCSPRRMLVSTVGDELKKAGGQSRVVGISLKDRSAILLAGRTADAAYWFDEKSGNFVTSTYYRSALPDWVKAFNSPHSGDRYGGVTWLNHQMPRDPEKLYKGLIRSPFGNEMMESLAEGAIHAEKLGQRDATDLLALSFSATDYIAHDYGPDSPELHEAAVRIDRLLEKLFQFIDREIGLPSVLIALTSDHGVAPLGAALRARNLPGGRYEMSVATDAVQKALVKQYGPGKWVAGGWDLLVYLNRPLIAEKKLDRAEADRIAARALLALPHVTRTYTFEQLMAGSNLKDETDRRMKNGFNAERSPDIAFLPELNWTFSNNLNTTHGTTYEYDSHVPLIFMGVGIRAGHYDSPVQSNDIAPTLARILEVPAPSASAGRVLSEMF